MEVLHADDAVPVRVCLEEGSVGVLERTAGVTALPPSAEDAPGAPRGWAQLQSAGGEETLRRVLHSLPLSRRVAPVPQHQEGERALERFWDVQTLALDSSCKFHNVGQLVYQKTNATPHFALRRPVLPAHLGPACLSQPREVATAVSTPLVSIGTRSSAGVCHKRFLVL